MDITIETAAKNWSRGYFTQYQTKFFTTSANLTEKVRISSRMTRRKEYLRGRAEIDLFRNIGLIVEENGYNQT